MSDPTAEDFLVNQQIKDFAFDLHDATRRSLDAFFDARGWLKPPLRFGGEGACRTGAGDLCAVADAPPPPRAFAEAAWLATPALW